MNEFVQRFPAIICPALIMLWSLTPAVADQKDTALDALFIDLVTSEDTDQSRATMGQVNAIWMQHPDQEVTQLMAVGSHMLNVGAWVQATSVFRAITEIDPEFAEGWNRLATALFYRGLNREALEPTRETLRLEPRHYGAIWGLGMIYQRLGREDQAKHYFELAHAIAPMLPGALDQARAIGARSTQGSENFDLR